jgi:uroporphyrinogen decarboxylase
MSTAVSLSSFERVDRMFERRDHDRVPRQDTYWAETIERWQREGLDGDSQTVLDLLEYDFHGVGGSWPAPFPGKTVTVEETDDTHAYIDDWGATVRYWKAKSGTPEHVAFGCRNRDCWENAYKPAYENYSWKINADATRNSYAEGRKLGKWCFLTALESFESTRRLMGDETTWIALAEDPEWVVDVSRVYTSTVIQGLDAVMQTGVEPDGLWIYGDMAFNHAPVCSPKMYRETLWHDHYRLAEWGHAHGMKVIFHTDGNVNPMIEHYIDAGFDCLQPLEAKAAMDVRRLCPQYGDRLACFGNIDVMVMGRNDPDELEEEVRTKLEAGKATRNYAYHSDHSVPPTASWATYQRLIELLDRYGNYDD